MGSSVITNVLLILLLVFVGAIAIKLETIDNFLNNNLGPHETDNENN